MSQSSDDPRLRQLVDGIVTLAAGDLSARITPSGDRDDIDAVITGVNLLAEELQQTYADLEQRVEDRTAMLRTARSELERMAMTDALTGLANRTLLGERIKDALDRGGSKGLPPALVMLDLDSFKSINDSLGHRAGDEVLVEVADRLRAVVRPGDTVARLGGDEFAILIPETTQEHADAIADRALAALQRPIDLSTTTVWAMASIGVRVGRVGQSATSLTQDADIAMYHAKSRGRNNVQVFDRSMLAAVQERNRIVTSLHEAVDRQEFLLHYQPVIELQTGRVIGFEALVRWNHPTQGLLLPDHFIGVAEETGLIAEIGKWVLREGVSQLRSWSDAGARNQDFVLQLNLSASELARPSLAEDVHAVLDEFGISPSRVVFEITETVLMTSRSAEAAVLDELRLLGVGLHIDDFGTGYSSISYLETLPVDAVKIDQSLISGLGTKPGKELFIAAVLQLISSAGMQAVAEGIESAEQAAQLHALGCLYGQGYYFGRPVPADQVPALLLGRRGSVG